MFDTPEADPTWSMGTQAVEADDAGPLDIPIPTAIAIRGMTKARYSQSASVETDDREPGGGDREAQSDDLTGPQPSREPGHEGSHHDQADGGGQGGQPGLQVG